LGVLNSETDKAGQLNEFAAGVNTQPNINLGYDSIDRLRQYQRGDP